MTWLLDGNLLVALRLDSHVHHNRAHHWFAKIGRDRFATCSVTQGTLLRIHMRLAVDNSARAAWHALSDFIHHPRHDFWEADFSYVELPHAHLSSSSQVTDAWLCELARRKSGRLATFDASLARLQADVAELVAE